MSKSGPCMNNSIYEKHISLYEKRIPCIYEQLMSL